MRHDGGERHHPRRILAVVLTLTALTLTTGGAVVSSESQSERPSEAGATGVQAAQATQPGGAAGMTVYRDPRTGRITRTPDRLAVQQLQAQAAKGLGDALSTSGKGLVEVQSPAKGGGVMIDLQGRFQSASVAASVDGATSIGCHANAPGPSQKGQ